MLRRRLHEARTGLQRILCVLVEHPDVKLHFACLRHLDALAAPARGSNTCLRSSPLRLRFTLVAHDRAGLLPLPLVRPLHALTASSRATRQSSAVEDRCPAASRP
eukprot:756824-Prymnesium_polylepis.1